MNKAKTNENKRQLLMCGNEAIAEAAIRAGMFCYFGYPITPQNEVTAYLSRRMVEEKRVFLQCESEIAAINMIFGASVVGKRTMTSSSSPGISLMQEGISYMVGCELPGVIVNIMRGGPGLGNIAPSQSDYFQATKGGGHGDYNIIVLAPSSVQEAINITQIAFDLSDEFRNPVMILGDGILGQMMEPVSFDGIKQQGFSKDWALTGAMRRPPQSIQSLYLKEGVLEEHNILLQKKFQRIAETQVRYESFVDEKDGLIIVAYGTVARLCLGVLERCRKEHMNVGFIRPITLWPFPSQVIETFANKGNPFFVVEMSYGQMVEDVRLANNGKSDVHFYGRAGGALFTVEEVFQEVKKVYKKYI
ncbi:3-methyl-2-oxobutanoate dehydrogenase subunit VorB [Chlamydiota bacterium]